MVSQTSLRSKLPLPQSSAHSLHSRPTGVLHRIRWYTLHR